MVDNHHSFPQRHEALQNLGSVFPWQGCLFPSYYFFFNKPCFSWKRPCSLNFLTLTAFLKCCYRTQSCQEQMLGLPASPSGDINWDFRLWCFRGRLSLWHNGKSSRWGGQPGWQACVAHWCLTLDESFQAQFVARKEHWAGDGWALLKWWILEGHSLHSGPRVCYHNSACMRAPLFQLCPTLCDPVDCSPPGFSVLGILQAMPFSQGSSRLRDQTCVSYISCIGK